MREKKVLILAPVIAGCLFFSCTPKTAQKQHAPETQALVQLMENDAALKSMLVKSIELAQQINPDKETNPAQTLDEYLDYLDWASTALPWNITPGVHFPKLYENIDQSLDYFYFIIDQPLPELEGKGYYNNSVQYYPPFYEWMIEFSKKYGQFLSTSESWKDSYFDIAYNDARFGLQNDWYEDKSNWHSFNDFFVRRLRAPDARPIAEAENELVVCAPADSAPQGVWKIDDNSRFDSKGVLIKSRYFNSVSSLLGKESAYKDAFAGGVLTHTFLDVNDYHRYHFPVSGVVKEVRVIAAEDAAGGITTWDADKQRYILTSNTPDWEGIETRGVVIVENEKLGTVALLPVGMSQVSSVNFEDNVKVGAAFKKGDPLGYFLFGGSDFVIVFQRGVNFSLEAPKKDDGSGYQHILMGELYGRVSD